MNVLAHLFNFLSLLIVASSFRIKESNYREIQSPNLWRRSNFQELPEQLWRDREVTKKDENYDFPTADYEQFRHVHGSSEIPEIAHDRLQNNSKRRQEHRFIFPRQNEAESAGVESFMNQIKMFHGKKDEVGAKFNNLLCLADCKMVDLMVFSKNQPGNASLPFENKPLAGRPYTFASLKDWCTENCGSKANSNVKQEEPKFNIIPLEKKEEVNPVASTLTQFGDGRSTKIIQNPKIPYVSFDGKPPRLLPAISPVIPTIFFPPIRNFYSYPNIMAAPLLYHPSTARRMEDVDETSGGVGFRSLREDPPKSSSLHPSLKLQRPHPKRRIHPGLAENNFYKSSRKSKSVWRNQGQGILYHPPEASTENIVNKTKYDEDDYDGSDNGEEYQDIYDSDYDGEDVEDESLDSVVRFLRNVSKILSNSAFRNLLKRASSCDTKGNVFPERRLAYNITK